MKRRNIRRMLRHELSSPSARQLLAIDLARVKPALVRQEIVFLEQKRKRMQIYGSMALGYFLFLLTLQILLLLDGERTLVPLFLTLPLLMAVISWMRQTDKDLLIFRILGQLQEMEEEGQSLLWADELRALDPRRSPEDLMEVTRVVPGARLGVAADHSRVRAGAEREPQRCFSQTSISSREVRNALGSSFS